VDLWCDFQSNTGRIIHKWHHYFPAYERHFRPFVGRPLIFLEIGMGDGGSMEMWRRYFGPYAQLIGLDIRPDCRKFENDQVTVFIGDQSDPALLDSIIAEFGAPDIVNDDGSHQMRHVTATFKHLYPKIPRHGVYMVEDLQTAHLPKYGGGVGHKESFLEDSKSLIDELFADHSKALPATEFSRSTNSISYYAGMVVFEKGIALPKTATLVGSTKHFGSK
jgi:hypothetical protein